MNTTSILFLCVTNSALSQIAEALARHRFGTHWRVQSAGTEPTALHPLVAEVMAEKGVSAAALHAKGLSELERSELERSGELFIVTLSSAEISLDPFEGYQRLHWPLADPARPLSGLKNAQREERHAHFLKRFREVRDQIDARLEIFEALLDAPPSLSPRELHVSIRVPHLAQGARFYSWLLGVRPKLWTHNYVSLISERLKTNFVLLIDYSADPQPNNSYHVGVELENKEALIEAQRNVKAHGGTLHRPLRTVRANINVHELWLKDPGGNLIELYARFDPAAESIEG